MKFLNASSASLALLALALTACGGKSPPNPGFENQMEKALVEGKLVPIVETFRSADYLTPCDQGNLSAMLEIAAALDEHQKEIDAFVADQITHPTSSKFKTVQVGPLLVRELIQSKAPTQGWKFYSYGWKQIIEDYQLIKGNPTPGNWSILNTEVRGIMTDDQSRIVNGYGYAIGYNDEPILQALLKATQDCALDTQCKYPAYAEDGSMWLNKVNYYVRRQAELRAATDSSQREKTLKYIIDGLTGALKNFQMRKEPSVKREGKTLHLPLYTSDLASITEQLSGYIESIWTSAELSLKIDWKAEASRDLFTVLLIRESSGRSFVSPSKKTVNLYNNVRAKSIAHEIGHVLGFTDHYYSVWNSTKCEYQDQSREDDLMSDPTYSKVLDDEWKTLQETYP